MRERTVGLRSLLLKVFYWAQDVLSRKNTIKKTSETRGLGFSGFDRIRD